MIKKKSLQMLFLSLLYFCSSYSYASYSIDPDDLEDVDKKARSLQGEFAKRLHESFELERWLSIIRENIKFERNLNAEYLYELCDDKENNIIPENRIFKFAGLSSDVGVVALLLVNSNKQYLSVTISVKKLQN